MTVYLVPLAVFVLLVYLYKSHNAPPPAKDADSSALPGEEAVPEPPAPLGRRILDGLAVMSLVVGVGFVALFGLIILVCAGGR